MTIDEIVGLHGGNRCELTTVYDSRAAPSSPPMFEKANSMSALYSSSVTAKIWGVALTQLNKVSMSLPSAVSL